MFKQFVNIEYFLGFLLQLASVDASGLIPSNTLLKISLKYLTLPPYDAFNAVQ